MSRPILVAIDSGLKRDDFPPFLGWGTPNYRAQRVVNYLLAHQNIAVGDMQILLRDDYILDAEEYKGLIFRAYKHAWPVLYDPNWEVGKAVQILRAWDNRAGLEGVGTLLFSVLEDAVRFVVRRGSAKRDILVREKVAFGGVAASGRLYDRDLWAIGCAVGTGTLFEAGRSRVSDARRAV